MLVNASVMCFSGFFVAFFGPFKVVYVACS